MNKLQNPEYPVYHIDTTKHPFDIVDIYVIGVADIE